MPLNIIVRSGSSKQLRRRSNAEKIIKGYYEAEEKGTYRYGKYTKSQIKDVWKNFEHEVKDSGDRDTAE